MSHVGGEVLSNRMSIQTTLSRRNLVKLRRKAFRRGVWFTTLNRVERACIDLTIKVVNRVRSLLLGKVLTVVVKKLSEAMESKITRLMREVGYQLASKISLIAQTWGYTSATQLALDLKFIRYLIVIKINHPKAHKT